MREVRAKLEVESKRKKRIEEGTKILALNA